MKLLLDNVNLISTSTEDPVVYYTLPVVGYFYKKRLAMVDTVLNQQKFETLLEIGYGSGIFLPELKEHCNSLYGVDVHKYDKEITQLLNSIGIKAELKVGDITNLPYRDSFFDCIVCISVLEHIKNLVYGVKEIYRVLKNNGVVIAGFPTKNVFMEFFYKNIFKFDSSKHHPNGHKEIVEKISQYFNVETILKFPSFLPFDMAFYIVVKARKTK